MARILAIPFDIECLIIEKLTVWSDILAILSLYQDHPETYMRALSCIRYILRDSSTFLSTSQRVSFYTQLLNMTQIREADQLVSFAEGNPIEEVDSIELFYSNAINLTRQPLMDLQFLTTLSIEFPWEMFTLTDGYLSQFRIASYSHPIIQFIADFFQYPLRQEQGHLSYYVEKLKFYDYIKINNLEDDNYTYDQLHCVGRIDVQTGEYRGLINGEWLYFLNDVLPHFIIRQLKLVTFNHQSFNAFIHEIHFGESKKGFSLCEMHEYLNLLDDVLSPEYPWSSSNVIYPNLNLYQISICPQNLTPFNSLDALSDTEDTYGKLEVWLEASRDLKELSMCNSPQFKRLSGWKFIEEAKALARTFQQGILDNLSRVHFSYKLSVNLFFEHSGSWELFRLFPQLVSSYYIIDPINSIQDELESINEMTQSHPHTDIIVFLSDSQLANCFGKHFARNPRIRFILV